MSARPAHNRGGRMGQVGKGGTGATGGEGPPPDRKASRIPPPASLLVGTSAAICELRALVEQVGPADATVLVTGPTGAGKDIVARALHASSPRRDGPFEAINCGAIPAHLAESEFFGSEAGAYTGALRARRGRIEAAHGGTLFLDEVGELPLDLQVKLLRVLETRMVERLGGDRHRQVDIRIIAATNRDLQAMVAEGRFREDLYWRLAVVHLDVPSLAERRADIPALVAAFVEQRGGTLALTADGADALALHGWPGNVRELRNLVDRALAFGEAVLDAPAVGRLLSPPRRPVGAWLAEPGSTAASCVRAHGDRPLPLVPEAELRPLVLKALLAEAEAAIIRQALDATGGTVARSARMLGLKRTTLVEKMRRMGLHLPAAGNA